MLKRFFVLTFLVLIPLFLHATRGEIIFEKDEYYVIETSRGCSVIEWYGGSILSEGDNLVGDLESYGFKDVYNLSGRCETHVYVEDYFLDEDDAIEMVYEFVG